MTVYSVVKNVLGSWHVMADGEPTGHQFATNAEAWRWVDNWHDRLMELEREYVEYVEK